MWRFKPFMPKEQTGLEGRSIDVGNIKVHVKNVIAEGGFSSVYLARDAINGSKQYALKHIICNDEESLDLVMKEISVMKSLRGHPNVVILHSRAIFDMGRTKEAIIVMEFCEKSLVNVLESRGSGYFEEKQVLTIFRDVCNAVFAMHCQSPPIAHRDLKAENILLGADGLWKLCDFGSTSTNHKRFEKPEEMGIEEDNIRKHTTPAYRAPEMWDLFRKDLINEKVDIWALGCLLFRICYFKSAFDGESKLQILNGNYCIPDFPKYSSYVTDMIRDMLQPSPEARPDITQVWFRVNDLLPAGIQKSLPDRPPEMPQATPDIHEGISNATRRASMPRRSPPPPPSSSESTRNVSPPHASRSGGIESSLGAFWSTQYAKDSFVQENKSGSRLDEEMANHNSLKHNENSPEKLHFHGRAGALGKENVQTRPVQHIAPGESCSRPAGFFQEDLDCGNGKSKERNSESTPTLQEAAFNAFVADFDSLKPSSSVPPINKPRKGDSLEAEAERLREQLRQANLEKAEITSKYEKLSVVCRLQRQEIQELKQALASTSPSPENQSSVTSQQALLDKSSGNAESKAWQPFPDDPGPQMPLKYSTPHSVRTRNNHQIKQKNDQSNQGSDGWGFGTDIFTAVPPGSSMISKSTAEGSVSQRFREPSSSPESKPASKPSGWAGF